MKKPTYTLVLLASFIITALFMTACRNDSGDNKKSYVSYTLTVENINVEQGAQATIAYTLTASDDSSTEAIPVTFVCGDPDGCDLVVEGDIITAGADEPEEVHYFIATVEIDAKTTITETFTVTVIAGSGAAGTDPSDPNSDPAADPSDPGSDPSVPGSDPSVPGTDPNIPAQPYTLHVNHVSVARGTSEPIHYTLTASDGSSTAAISVTFACDTPGCTLTVVGGAIAAVANEPKANHNFTATAKKDGETVATDTFIVTVIDLDGIEVAGISINDMSIYRLGGNADSRTIMFTLFDNDQHIIDNSIYLASVSVIYTSDTLAITDGVIQSDKNYALGEHTVSATAYYHETEKLADGTFTVTVERFLLDVTFFNGSSAIERLGQKIEYGETAAEPDDPDLSGYDFDGWYTSTGFSTPFNFDAPITGAVKVYGKFVPYLDVVITLDAGAPLQDGESVWIKGAFYDTAAWSSHPLSDDGDGVWTITLRDILWDNMPIPYNVFAEEPTDWAIRAVAPNDPPLTCDYTPGEPLEYTVTAWLGRPYTGELLGNPGFEDTPGSSAPGGLSFWTISGWKSGLTATHSNDIWFDYAGHTDKALTDGSGDTYFVDNDSVFTVSQTIDAFANGLSPGTTLTFSVWVKRVNTNQKDAQLFVGAQAKPVPLSETTGTWIQYSLEFTVTDDDIVDYQITAGWRHTTTTGSNLSLDDFSLMVKTD